MIPYLTELYTRNRHTSRALDASPEIARDKDEDQKYKRPLSRDTPHLGQVITIHAWET